MRHGKKFNHLGRQTAHRKAMLANMGCSLIEHKRINTTVAKAKAFRTFIEPIITKSKTDTTHNRRTVFSYLRSKEAVTELFKEISVKVADRPGGYIRIIKLGNRQGDNAPMAMVELVDYNELYNPKGNKAKKNTRRSRRGAKTADAAVETQTSQEEE
ncbi:50S ribosomal protein L17 [Tenacibaculum sp. Bg11-29]|uniref:50S ribosomal protein L17 n=1 Tax=Tenacibaculum sp. Bg11-29 TaxID=2058306 RepID=UPI000C337933|nr:50S ribosomal protein L17 [Tenacibaculum sp. Bg11-29]PKH52741.1 50S ribosomal protein L17 [Tenacibaculum sp. Bg11-29]